MIAIGTGFAQRPRQVERVALIAVALTVLVDHWLWADQPGGALAMVMLVLPLVAVALQAGRRPVRPLMLAAGLALIAPLPLAEATSLLSFTVSATFAALAVLFAAGRLPQTWGGLAARLFGFALSLPARLPIDLLRLRRLDRRGAALAAPQRWRQVRLLLMPAGLGLVFLGLFAEANPVIEGVLRGFDPLRWLGGVNGWRLVWLGCLLLIIWGFLRPGHLFANTPANRGSRRARPPLTGDSFGAAAILRALILFNAIFAVETALDLWLLWGGGALPEGMTFAEYAHRGTYPLIVTALLAAAFVLIALRPGSAAAESRIIRVLVYVWIAQTILLVGSAIHRTDLYVGVYGLTFLRIAAFIWMGLVAGGLALIVARIALRRTADWLIGANLVMLGLVLFIACFVDFTAMISHRNIDRRGDDGAAMLDIEYIVSLGPHAIPAVDKVLAAGEAPDTYRGFATWLRDWREGAADAHRAAMIDWRAWTRRDLALLSYLDAQPNAPHTQPEDHP